MSTIHEQQQTCNLKKRGRKPKGGNIIPQAAVNIDPPILCSNVILHLKCFLKDLNTIPSNENDHNHELESTSSSISSSIQTINPKIINIYVNNINNKRCFWDTCCFENEPILIPKIRDLNGTWEGYGCFCSIQCAVAYLFRENLDTSIKFERYSYILTVYSYLLNNNDHNNTSINTSMYIYPACDPNYSLNKFYGNLTINEYRKHLNMNKFYVTVFKPLTRILPEIHEDHEQFKIHDHRIPFHKPSSVGNASAVLKFFSSKLEL